MPKPVKLGKNKEFTFKERSSQGKYEWDKWFNGDLLLIERSTGGENDKGTIVSVEVKRDYEVPTNAMPPKIVTAARRRYKVCDISRTGPDGERLVDSLIIRARDMTDEEREYEDLKRAEEKAKRAETGEQEQDDEAA